MPPSYGGDSAAGAADQSLKCRKPKSREVSSRFLSISASPSLIESGNQSSANPTETLIRSKSNSSSSDPMKKKSFEKSGFFRGLWPSSSSPKPKPENTLAECIGHDRMRDNMEERKSKWKRDQYPLFLNRQRSCTEFSRFDESEKKLNCKENQKPVSGGSTRYTEKLKFAGKSSNLTDEIVSGRFSVDENSLRKKPFGLSDSDATEYSESESFSDACSSFEAAAAAGKNHAMSYMASTVSSRKHGIEVPSKFLRDSSSKSRKSISDSSPDPKLDSPNISSLKKGNSNCAASPGRTPSPKGKLIGLANSKPPTSPSRGKGGVGNILSLGIELLKGKKASSAAASSPLGPGSAEGPHQLRILQSRLIQWRYGNARAEAVDESFAKRAEKNLLHAWNALTKLKQSVLQRKLQLQKEKLEWKLNYILHSQIKILEMWENMERQHLSAVFTMKDCLHSVVCRLPLVDGAKVELQTSSIVVRHASDIAASINLMLTTFSPMIEETVEVLSELAMVVTQEKLLLEEYLDLYTNISALEVRERSLKSGIMQLNLLKQQQQQYYSMA